MLQLNFEKVIIHNFLSYGHAEIPLSGNNYCMVSGVNNNPLDNAVSNGSGKSSWTSAICWALTGATIQGLTSNIKNINVEEDSCWVELTFKVNNDSFKVLRQKNPKADLKIFLNGSDISGKGIRESETILAKHLPDLNSQLLASIVILGQGLPNKFTANTPSGRKEVLEKLSKSDFMIQDLKERITKRAAELSNQLRANEDELLAKTTAYNVLQQQLVQKQNALKAFETPKDFDTLLATYEKQLEELTTKLTETKKLLSVEEEKVVQRSAELNEKNEIKQKALLDENSAFATFQSQYSEKKGQLNAYITSLQKQINDIMNIREVCPTCGQKIPGVLKPDTTSLEQSCKEAAEQLIELNNKFTNYKVIHDQELEAIEDEAVKDSVRTKQALQEAVDKKHLFNSQINKDQDTFNKISVEVTKVKLEKASYESSHQKLLQEISDTEQQLHKIDEEKMYISNRHDDITAHNKVVSQMNTLIKRDFRGYLLQDIISYIEQRAKIYSSELFGGDELTFALDGNNINIAYCNKAFENLSGGEKQKVDLIIQFSIRDMMQQYLGFSSNILVMDEIFDALDINGCNSVLNLIAKHFTDLDSVYIISHRADELEIPYDSEFVIVKDTKGISSILYH